MDEAGKNSSSVGAGEGNAKIGWTKFRERFGKQDQEEEEEAGNGEEGWKKAIEMDLKVCVDWCWPLDVVSVTDSYFLVWHSFKLI